MHKYYNYTKIKKREPNLEKLKNCLDKWGHYKAPSLTIVPILLDDGATVKAYDPYGINRFKQKINGDIISCETPEEALKDADICFILTEWPEIVELEPEAFLTMRRPIIMDGRNCYKLEDMEGHNLVYESIGRRVIQKLKP